MSAREIVRALGGKWYGKYGLAPGPGHSKHDRSMKIADGSDGDIVCHSFVGDDWKAFKDDLRARGLLPEWQGSRGDKVARRASQRRRSAPLPPDNGNLRAAREIWSKSVPAADTLVETYLRGRGITLPVPPVFDIGVRPSTRRPG